MSLQQPMLLVMVGKLFTQVPAKHVHGRCLVQSSRGVGLHLSHLLKLVSETFLSGRSAAVDSSAQCCVISSLYGTSGAMSV